MNILMADAHIFNVMIVIFLMIDLDWCSVVCVSRLALCSKSFRDVLIEWINTVRPHNRLIPHFRRYAQVQWILPCLGDPQPSAPSPPFPADFRLDVNFVCS